MIAALNPSGIPLHELAVHFESQAQFGYVTRPRQGSAGPLLDPVQPITNRIRVTEHQFASSSQ